MLRRLVLNSGSLALLVSLGCVPDYSPDVQLLPSHDAARPRSTRDAGVGSQVRDARASAPDDAPGSDETPEANVDEHGLDAGDGEPDSGLTAMSEPPPDGCDLRGRWLVNERMMTNGLGARQVVNTWYLYEIAQSGEALSVARSLACGSAVRGLPPIEANGDMSKAFPAMLAKTTHTGRLGSVATTDDGCRVQFDKLYITYGLSVPFYLDPSRPLPDVSQPATDSEPGWEDWDNDGMPGVAVRMTGAISGKLHMASRTWTHYSGSSASDAESFVLALEWDQEKVTLAIDGSPLLDLEGVRDGDETQHRVELARLSELDALSDDAAQCAELRRLAPNLTPSASE